MTVATMIVAVKRSIYCCASKTVQFDRWVSLNCGQRALLSCFLATPTGQERGDGGRAMERCGRSWNVCETGKVMEFHGMSWNVVELQKMGSRAVELDGRSWKFLRNSRSRAIFFHFPISS